MSLYYKNELVGGAINAGDGLEKNGNILNVITPVIPITKAEYDALTEDEKSADALYLVDEPQWVSVPLSLQDYDTQDGWHVRKWSDGYVEMTYLAHDATFDFIREGGLAWNGGVFGPFAYPFHLQEVYCETCTIAKTSCAANLFPLLSGNTPISHLEETYAYSVGSIYPPSGSHTINLSIHVTGRWK